MGTAADPGKGKQTASGPFQCPLCGETAAQGQQACGSCPLNSGCVLICCPRCGYTVPGASKVETWFRKLFRRGKEPQP